MEINLDTELAGFYENMMADQRLIYVSAGQVRGLNSLLRMGLEDDSPEVRHEVLDIFAGEAMKLIANVPRVQSAKNLTSPVASFLITQLKEENSTPWRLSAYGRRVIELAEERAKVQLEEQAEKVLPR